MPDWLQVAKFLFYYGISFLPISASTACYSVPSIVSRAKRPTPQATKQLIRHATASALMSLEATRTLVRGRQPRSGLICFLCSLCSYVPAVSGKHERYIFCSYVLMFLCFPRQRLTQTIYLLFFCFPRQRQIVRLHLSSAKRKSPSFALHCIRFALTLSPNQPNTHYIPDHELVNNAF